MAENHPPDDSTRITRDELLKFIELDLWSRFVTRLWAVLSVLLTLVTVAGYFGVSYYIRSEIERRLNQQQALFAARVREAATYGELLEVTAVRYHEARFELQKDIGRLQMSLRTYRASLNGSDQAIPLLDHLLTDLDHAQSLTNYVSVVSGLGADVPVPLASLPVVASGSITQIAQTIQGITPITTIHPIQDGTLLGAVRDIRYRLLELEAYREALADLESDLVSLGATDPTERRQLRVSLAALHDDTFAKRYNDHRKDLAQNLLDPVALRSWESSRALYMLDTEINLREAPPNSYEAPGRQGVNGP